MNTVLIIVFILLALLVIWQWRVGQRVKGMQGQSAPDTSSVDGDLDTARKVYYFHATHCKPCKSVMPLVDKIRQDHPNLIKLEVSENIALARAFKLAGTPSFYAVRNGVIQAVKLGIADEQWLRSYLQEP